MWWAAGVESEARLVHVWAAVACWRRAFGRREDVFMLQQVVPTGRAGLFLVRTGHASYFEIKTILCPCPTLASNPEILLPPRLRGPHLQPVQLCARWLLPGLCPQVQDLCAPATRDPHGGPSICLFSHCCAVLCVWVSRNV